MRWLRRSWATVIFVIAALVFVWTRWVSNWFYHPLGSCTPKPNCLGYQAWSGVISDVSEITLLFSAIAISLNWYRHHLCMGVHDSGKTCRRIGIHPVANTALRTCWIHHPVLSKFKHHHVPAVHIHEAHKLANPHMYHDNGELKIQP